MGGVVDKKQVHSFSANLLSDPLCYLFRHNVEDCFFMLMLKLKMDGAPVHSCCVPILLDFLMS